MYNRIGEAEDYDSNFGDTQDSKDRGDYVDQRQRRQNKIASDVSKAKASTSVFRDEVSRDEGRRQRHKYLALNAYDRHKLLINEYLLNYPGAIQLLQRDTSKDKSDLDVIKENHRFLWDNIDNTKLTWEQQLAKNYYDKLFHEYCICDLSRFKENKIAMRWQTEKEVKDGKGQFQCGARKCHERDNLRTWEVNFAYQEENERKNALVKVRLCPECSYRLNYHHKRKDVTKRIHTKKSKKDKKAKSKHRKRRHSSSSESDSNHEQKHIKLKHEESLKEKELEQKASEIWSEPVQVEQEKSREEDFSEFLEDLFL